jgi:hypothetical protein
VSAVSLAPQTAVLGFSAWRRRRHHIGSNFSLSEANTDVANPLRAGSRNRTKESIDTVRHRHLNFDIGEAELTSLPTSDTVPTPTAIISTSLDKYQILWRVAGFTFPHQESTFKLRTVVFGSDLDCTGCNRILQLQGSPNCEYDSAYPFTVEHSLDFHSESRWLLVGYFSDEHRAFASRNHIANASRGVHDFGGRLGADSARGCPCKWCDGVVAKGACIRGGVHGFYARF